MMIRIVLILLLLCSPAFAHDASRPELNNWFDHLSSGKGQRFLGITRSGWMSSPMIRAASRNVEISQLLIGQRSRGLARRTASLTVARSRRSSGDSSITG